MGSEKPDEQRVELGDPLERHPESSPPVEVDLVHRLSGAAVAELRRPVGGEHHERDA